ncbi:dihydropteroate synthase [Limnohabitans sp.]|uniref:dihydropteroate synthase n=1 Tax=Limnohabitans sp. TaxID=1907725 RepID=UPI00311E4486
MNVWTTRRFDIDLTQPKVMGIVNLTPDSFSDGGVYNAPDQALAHAEHLLREGADMLDIGAESTRPGAPAVPLQEELARLEPVVKELVRWNVPVSIDTYKPEVMQAVLAWGVDVINDVWALRQPGAWEVVSADSRIGVCLMHMHREPGSMQVQPMQGDVLEQVQAFFAQALLQAQQHGVSRQRVALDPGIGFGKTVQQNLTLLREHGRFHALGCPTLVGWSRKSTLGAVLAERVMHGQVPEPAQRVQASVAAALLSVERGARIVRVHDVAPTVQALALWGAMQDH